MLRLREVKQFATVTEFLSEELRFNAVLPSGAHCWGRRWVYEWYQSRQTGMSSYCWLLSTGYVLSAALAPCRLSQWVFTTALSGRYCSHFWKMKLREVSCPGSELTDPGFRKRSVACPSLSFKASALRASDKMLGECVWRESLQLELWASLILELKCLPWPLTSTIQPRPGAGPDSLSLILPHKMPTAHPEWRSEGLWRGRGRGIREIESAEQNHLSSALGFPGTSDLDFQT